MFGIRGLDAFGLVHSLLGVAALLLGLAVLLRRKGTPVHRRIGQAYVVSMLFLNVTALMIYDLSGRFGPFHIASLISLITVGAGPRLDRSRQPTAGVEAKRPSTNGRIRGVRRGSAGIGPRDESCLGFAESRVVATPSCHRSRRRRTSATSPADADRED